MPETSERALLERDFRTDASECVSRIDGCDPTCGRSGEFARLGGSVAEMGDVAALGASRSTSLNRRRLSAALRTAVGTNSTEAWRFFWCRCASRPARCSTSVSRQSLAFLPWSWPALRWQRRARFAARNPGHGLRRLPRSSSCSAWRRQTGNLASWHEDARRRISTRLTGESSRSTISPTAVCGLPSMSIATERPTLRYVPQRLRASARASPEGLRIGSRVAGIVRLRPAYFGATSSGRARFLVRKLFR